MATTQARTANAGNSTSNAAGGSSVTDKTSQADTVNAGNSTSNATINSPVTEKASEAAHHAVDVMAEKAAAAEDSLRKTAASSKATIDEKQEQLKMQMQGSYDRSKQFARENPLAAAGIAFAAGMLVSALLRRGN